MGVMSRKERPENNTMATVGIVLSIVGIVLSIIAIIVYAVVLANNRSGYHYYY